MNLIIFVLVNDTELFNFIGSLVRKMLESKKEADSHSGNKDNNVRMWHILKEFVVTLGIAKFRI